MADILNQPDIFEDPKNITALRNSIGTGDIDSFPDHVQNVFTDLV